MEYIFYIPCIREWPFDSYGEQEDYPGSKLFSTSFTLYKTRSCHLILASREVGKIWRSLNIFVRPRLIIFFRIKRVGDFIGTNRSKTKFFLLSTLVTHDHDFSLL